MPKTESLNGRLADRWLTIAQFAETVQICEATYFKLKRQGLGPEETRFGNVVRISPDALREWRQRMREMQEQKRPGWKPPDAPHTAAPRASSRWLRPGTSAISTSRLRSRDG